MTGTLYYPWVVPGAIVVVIFMAAVAGLELLGGRHHARYAGLKDSPRVLVFLHSGKYLNSE